MSQIEELQEEEQTPAEGTENTEYEGMTEEEVERAEFDKAVDDDPDIDEEKLPDQPELEEAKSAEEDPGEEPPAAKTDDPPAQPTGLEWLDHLSEEDRATASNFIDRQGQQIARLDQRVSSHLGQLRPTQRSLSQAVHTNKELREQLAKQTPSNAVDIENRIKDFSTWADEEYKEFPEEAAKLKARFTESLDGVSEVLQNAAPADPAPQPAGPDRTDEAQHLASAYSDWGERRFSPEFDQWIARQPDETTQLLNSAYASDNIALLDAFTRDNPMWVSPQTPENFHSLRQAQFSPLFRGWAQGEGLNPDMNVAGMQDHQRDSILTHFKSDLGVVVSELEQDPTPTQPQKVTRLSARRSKQLKNRDPGSRRTGVKPGQKIDLSTEEGQRAYYDQLVQADPDL